MNVFNPQIHHDVHHDATEPAEAPGDSPVSKMTAEILPTCFLLAIIGGFAAFVAFGQAILPAIIAALAGAFLGLFFSCGETSHQQPTVRPRIRS